jgi:tetratricopeptide (TPR) repeat protein
MDFLKTRNLTALFSAFVMILLFITTPSLRSQTPGLLTSGNSEKKDVIEAFKQSHEYEKKGQLGKAIDALMEVYDGSSYEINVRLGWLYYHNKQYSTSIEYYNNAIKIMPYALESKFGLVLPCAALEDWATVAEQYKAILTIDPQNTLANYRLGLIYYYKPDYELALKHFEKVGNLYPFDYDTIIMIGWSSWQLGKMREAKVLFEHALMIRPDDISALEGLSLIK